MNDKSYNPPSIINIRYCPECGRNDRFNNLPDKHYKNGKICSGKVIFAIYNFDRISKRSNAYF